MTYYSDHYQFEERNPDFQLTELYSENVTRLFSSFYFFVSLHNQHIKTGHLTLILKDLDYHLF